MKIFTLNGINLNMFGKRDPKPYGTVTLDEINGRLRALGQEFGAEIAKGPICGFGADSYLLGLRAAEAAGL
jgi:3-dehydroquinate dehydratase